MKYSEVYKQAQEIIPADMVDDYRPADYSKGFQLIDSSHINSIIIWLKNGDEIIYTARENRQTEKAVKWE